MRKIPVRITLLFSAISLMAFTTGITKMNTVYSLSNITTPAGIELLPTEPIVMERIEIPTTLHADFLEAVGMRESSNNYTAVNQFGYLGKYQFGRRTLDGLGYKDVTNREFLDNPEIQESAMNDLLKHNKRILKRQIKKYVGQTINNVYITESGLLAAAHLAGPGNVKKFFRKGYEFKDGNGTTMTSYMVLFSDYLLDIR